MRDYSTAEHETLADAILSGDAERAENTMRQHLRHTGDGLMQLPVRSARTRPGTDL